MKNKVYEINMDELKNVSFEEIEIGEIFACNGCWQIWVKMGKEIKDAFCIADDYASSFDSEGYYLLFEIAGDTSLYKLPKRIQKLWGEQE